MQALTGIANALGQQGLHVHVDILGVHGELYFPSFNVRQQLPQALGDGGSVRLGNDAGVSQHLGMGQRALNVLPVHPLVKTDGGIKIIRQLTGYAVGSSGPHLCHKKALLV